MSIKDNPQDYGDLKRAVGLLESPSLTARLSGVLGSPIESAVKALPNWVSGKINDAVVAALQTSADAALWSLENTPKKQASTLLHKVYAATSGALGGAFGFAALFVELPISTTIMMRSVADVARSEGFDLNDLATKQACIEVFAIHSDADAMQWFGTDPMTDYQQAEQLLTLFAGWRALPNTGVRWGIERQSEPGLLGTCGLFKWNRPWPSLAPLAASPV